MLEKNHTFKQIHPLQEAGVVDARALAPEDKRSGLFSWPTGVLSTSAMSLMSGCGGSGFDPGPSHALIDPVLAQDNFSMLGAVSIQSTPKSLVAVLSPTLSASEPSTTDATALFNWAESQYPALFPAGSKNLIYGSYLYRYYPSTCLLYTSPSPRDGLLSRMPSSA